MEVGGRRRWGSHGSGKGEGRLGPIESRLGKEHSLNGKGRKGYLMGGRKKGREAVEGGMSE